MKEQEIVDASNIGTHPNIIKNALEELSETDVLVCGKCHSVFHFLELFREHKEEGCGTESIFKDTEETNSKLWAFLLWKSSRNSREMDISPWNWFLKWSRLEKSTRETWLMAGRIILSFNKHRTETLQETPVKITRNAPFSQSNDNNLIKKTSQRLSDLKASLKTYTNNTESEISTPKNISSQSIKKTILATNASGTLKTLDTENNVMNKVINLENCRAPRSVPNSKEFEQHTVEKIIAKRYNPRRKFHEFLVKWVGMPHEQNTWEPHFHLGNCTSLIESFENQLARQKEQKAVQEAKKAAAVAQQQKEEAALRASSPQLSPTGRPFRNSKSKALDQVKQWCTDDETSSGLKRKYEDTDFDSSRTGDDNEDIDSDDEQSKQVSKRLKNGSPVAINATKPDSKPGVKITQQQKTIKAVNGSYRPIKNIPSAEVIITKDINSSGIIKKSGNIISNVTQKGEAEVRFLSKGENATSGIVRINANAQKIPSPPALTTLTTRITQVVPKKATGNQVISSVGGQITKQIDNSEKSHISKEVPANGIKTVQRSAANFGTSNATISRTNAIHQRTAGSQIKTVTQRSSISPNLSNTVHSPNESGSKILNQRIVKSAPNSKTVTPEQRILQLSKSGDLKVTRKVVNQGPQQQSHAQNNLSRNEDISQSDGSVADDSFQQPGSPAQALTLCPVTGKFVSDVAKSTAHTRISGNNNVTRVEVETSLHANAELLKKDDSSVQDQSIDQEQQDNLQAPNKGGRGQQLVLDHNSSHTQSQQDSQTAKSGQLQQQQSQQDQHLQLQAGTTLLETESGTLTLAASGGEEDQTTAHLLANEDGTPLLVTGEDGTIYQVAGKNAEGQTILIAQGADGEQQFAYVAAEEGEEAGVLTLDNAVAEAVAQMLPEQQAEALAAAAAAGNTGSINQNDVTQALNIQTGDSGDSQDANIPAEVVQADPPSPGGTRRVVLLLQDGSFMVTEMQDEEYQALNLVG